MFAGEKKTHMGGTLGANKRGVPIYTSKIKERRRIEEKRRENEESLVEMERYA